MVDMPALAATPAGMAEDVWKAACDSVRASLGWHVAPSIVQTVTLDGTGRARVFFPTLHLTAVASLIVEGRAGTVASWSPVGVAIVAPTTTALSGITATITHGYDQCPPDLLEVVAEVARAKSTPRKAGLKSRTAGPFREEYGDGFTAAQSSVLDRYRILDLF